MMRRSLLATASCVALAITATSADAAVLIQGTGLWGASATSTAYTAPSKSFQFSFSVPDVISTAAGYAFTSAITNFSYTLDGATVSGTPSEVRFNDAAGGGLLSLILGGVTVSLYGSDIGSNGVPGPSGAYSFTSGLNGGAATGNGFLTVTSIAAAVPEPAVWGLMIVGFGVMAGALRYQRRQTSVRYA